MRGIGWALAGWAVGLFAGNVGAAGQSDRAGEAPRGQAPHDPPPAQPWPTAGDAPNVAVLSFSILDQQGRPMPGRLTFIADDSRIDLFPNAEAAPDELAVRQNVIYTRSGRGAVTVPPGRYTVYASRGLEWSIQSHNVVLKAGGRSEFVAQLRHEVNTTGWVSGDFHLHTLTYSGHGDANMKERVITFLGEGLELAVATDHNHHTDYRPTMNELGVTKHLTAITGNEVSTPIGHFNAFPLDPAREPPPSRLRDANELFQLIRMETNEHGVTPIIQLNHPRWGGIDYFGKADLDPVTGEAHDSLYSDDFDSIEVLNENEGWGYYDSEIMGSIETKVSRHWVLRDWFNLLNRGHRYAAVGNSDSHTVRTNLAGYPRNYISSSTDDPGRIDVAEVAAAVRNRRVFTTLGPFVEYWIDGAPMGSEITSKTGTVDLRVKVQAASWVDCDRIKIVVNGDVVREIPVPDSRRVQRIDTTVQLYLNHDSWITLLVEGDDSLAPIVHDQDRPILPLAIMNPIWINVDGDGLWTSPWRRALALATSTETDAHPESLVSGNSPSQRGLILLATAQAKHPTAMMLIKRGLRDDDRLVQLFAARSAAILADAAATPELQEAYTNNPDPYLRVVILQSLQTLSPGLFRSLAFDFVDSADATVARRYGPDLFRKVPSQIVRDWQVVGYFPNPDSDTLVTTAYGPEHAMKREPPPASQAAAMPFVGKNDAPVTWKELRASDSGFLNLRDVSTIKGLDANAIAYARTWLHSPDARSVRIALGTDDGCRFWLNDSLLYEDNTRHGATPYQHLMALPLKPGWNSVLLKVENGVGSFGLYFRLFDEEIRVAAKPS